MFNHLKGLLISKDPGSVVVECGGVGYSLRVPMTTFEKLPQPGEECLVLTYLHVREDVMELFGFAEEVERRMFRKLIGVSGVGPAAAMSIMSQKSVEEICSAIRKGDHAPLQKAKGVGRKTAERVVLELRGDVKEFEAMMSVSTRKRVAAAGTDKDFKGTTALALVNLGYSEQVAERAAQEAVDELGDASLSELLRDALKRVR